MAQYGYDYVGSGQMQMLKKWASIEKTERISAHFFYLNRTAPVIYSEQKTNRSEARHLTYLKSLIDSFKIGDVLVMVSMQDISTDEATVGEIYGYAWKRGIDLRFLETPWVNIGFLKGESVSLTTAQAVIAEMYKAARHEAEEIASAKAYVRAQRGSPKRGRTFETRKSKECRLF